MTVAPRRPPVAIVGIGRRLPAADDEDPFKRIPPERFDAEAFAADLANDGGMRAALLHDVELGWHDLRMPPAQLASMHHMEKVALRATLDAIANARLDGATPSPERTRVIFAAPTLGPDPHTDHSRRIRHFELSAPILAALDETMPQCRAQVAQLVDELLDTAPAIDPDAFSATASITAGRVANVCDFRGGHMAIDAGFASSLAAIDAATSQLARGSADCAVVCAVSPLVAAPALLAFAARDWLTAARPSPFAADADGTLLGEGAVAVVLVREEDLGDRRVYAWIDGVGGCTAEDEDVARLPTATAEAARRALAAAGCSPSQVAAIESRALGVRAIDRAEHEGLRSVYGTATLAHLRSTVAEVGFLQGAAGMVALAAAAEALHRSPERGRIAVSDAGAAGLAYHAVLRASGGQRARRGDRAASDDALAITGMGLIVPGASDVDAYWSNVLAGASFITDFPPGRWDVDAMTGTGRLALRSRLAAVVEPPVGDADPSVSLAVRAGEAALRDAGHRPEAWDPARVAVIFGELSLRGAEADVGTRALFAEYLHRVHAALVDLGAPADQIEATVAAARRRFDSPSPPWNQALRTFSGAACAQELARRHGFSAPAFVVDALCASSLAAVELAAERLCLGEVDAGVAGGVAWNLIPEYYIVLSVLGALSSRGAPPFSPDRDGFVPAEGAGAVVLRRLSDARAAGEPIRAVLRGIGAASDGRGRSVFAPTTRGQRLAVERALRGAGATVEDIDYVEAHGTGTQLGDATEIETYAQSFAGRTRALPLGSAKSQVGHLSSAAGIVGLIRTACALAQGVLPPSAGDGLDPELHSNGLRVELVRDPAPWPARAAGERLAGVSAFGLGGINYHAVLADEIAAHAPAAGAARPRADLFVVELVPLALRTSAPRYSLTGRRLLLLDGEASMTGAVERALRARGADLRRAHTATTADVAGLDGIVDLTALRRTPSAGLPADLERRAGRIFELLAATYDRFEAEPGGCYVAVTGLGCDTGLSGAEGDLFGAFLAGLARSLKQELPQLLVKAIDVDPLAAPDGIAEAVVREIENGGDRVDVAYAGRRLVPNLRRISVDAPMPDLGFDPGDVVLFSGGGRGVVYVCARALAERGVTAVVTGRTPPPDPAVAWLELDDAAFGAYRIAELERRAREEGITPTRFNREFAVTERQRELHANLREAERLGLPLRYEVCDITSHRQVENLATRLRNGGERITGIVHGAMVERSMRLPKKTPAHVVATLAPKVVGLWNLLEATRTDDLRSVICFGSGSGRFGLEGQTDYSAANALMAALLAADGRRDPRPLQRLTIDWTAWEGVGAAARDSDISELVRRTGVTWIDVAEGTTWFLGELARRRSGEIVVFEERMLRELRFVGGSAEGPGERAVALDDRGLPLVPGDWPLVDRVVSSEPRSLSLERRLDPARDIFLDQHRLHGTPILPATFGCELLAEAAALLCPGFEVAALEDFTIEAPAKVPDGETLLVVGRADLIGESADERLVRVESRSDLVAAGKTLRGGRLHHRATVRLVAVGTRASRAVAPRELDAAEHARSFFERGGGAVQLGPLYRRARGIRIAGREVTGAIDPPPARGLLTRSSDPLFRLDPLLMDAALQVAANWDGHERGLTSIPLSIAHVERGRAGGSAPATVQARVADVEDPVVVYDVTVCDERGELLLELRAARLHRLTGDKT